MPEIPLIEPNLDSLSEALERTYGVGRGDHYEPAGRGSVAETAWSSERYLASVPPLFDRLRREFGPDLHLLHDAHHRLTPIEAARLGRALEPYALFAEYELLIGAQAFERGTLGHDRAFIKDDPALRDELQHVETVRDQNNGCAALPQLFDPGQTLVLEFEIADGERFVDQ